MPIRHITATVDRASMEHFKISILLTYEVEDELGLPILVSCYRVHRFSFSVLINDWRSCDIGVFDAIAEPACQTLGSEGYRKARIATR